MFNPAVLARATYVAQCNLFTYYKERCVPRRGGASVPSNQYLLSPSPQCALALHRVKVSVWFYFKVIWATTVARAGVCVMSNPKRARLTKRDILDEFDNPLSSDEEDCIAVDSDDGEVDHVEEEIHLPDEEDAEMAPTAPS
ncbi:hypothetical protein J6590_085766, partial [Homalodisca vitripennis]